MRHGASYPKFRRNWLSNSNSFGQANDFFSNKFLFVFIFVRKLNGSLRANTIKLLKSTAVGPLTETNDVKMAYRWKTLSTPRSYYENSQGTREIK